MLRTNEPGQLPASVVRVVSRRVYPEELFLVAPPKAADGRRYRAAWRAALSRRLTGGAIAPLNGRRYERRCRAVRSRLSPNVTTDRSYLSPEATSHTYQLWRQVIGRVMLWRIWVLHFKAFWD